jgi:hypothetical protein
MLGHIKSRLTLPPLSVTSNFESAFFYTAFDVFPGKQSLWRKIGEVGLVTDYNDSENEKMRLILKL